MTVATAEATDIRSVINPLPSQERLLDAQYEYEYLLFGGAAGPGKSYILRWAAIDFLLYAASQGHYNVRVGLFCEDYPSLKDRQVTKIRREFPSWLGELRGSQDEGYGFFLRPQWGSGAIMLRNLDKPAKYASAEFAAIYVDELTKNTRQTFDDLRFRKRWPGMDHNPFVGASNPGSVGHAWVKQLWVDEDFSGDNVRLDPATFLFIPALAGENPYLPPSYWNTLNSLPDAMRRAMLEGDWTVFAGQCFDEWRRERHVCDPFKIPAGWTRWVAVDYGFAAPFCALWFARTPDKSRIYIYRELYQTGWRGHEQAVRIKDASKGEKIWLYAADPSMWQKRRETTGDTIADEYSRGGIGLMKANNERLAGLNCVREALNWKELPPTEQRPEARLMKEPRLQVFRTCTNLIRTLPALPYDPIKVEDVDCFTAGTQVSTPQGSRAIETLRVGNLVDTPIGPQPVIKDGISGYAPVVRVRLSTGDYLEGTLDHKAYVRGRGLVPLVELRVSDILMPKTIAEAVCTRSHSTEILSALSRISRRVITSTIRTLTRLIMTLATSLFFQPASTLCFTYAGGLPTQSSSARCTFGTTLRRVGKSSATMPARCESEPPSENLRAAIVGKLLRRDTLTKSSARSAAPIRRGLRGSLSGVAQFAGQRFGRLMRARSPVRIVAAGHYVGVRRVYNLTVAHAHLYFANGVLVTNTDAEDHCLVGETLVDTATGPRRIDSLTDGWTWSYDGAPHRFRRGRLTQRNVPVLQLTLADGRSARATGEHRFLMLDGSWRRLRDLKDGDVLLDVGHTVRYNKIRYDCSSDQPDDTGVSGSPLLPLWPLLSTEGCQAAPRGVEVLSRHCSQGSPHSSQRWSEGQQPAVESGGDHTRLSPRSALCEPDTCSTESPSAEPEGDSGVARLTRGTGLALEEREASVEGTGADRSRLSDVRRGLPHPLPNPLQVLPPKLQGQGVAVASVQPAGRADVYNVAVDDIHSFSIEGGLIAHNCYDTLRYGLMAEVRAEVPSWHWKA